MTAPVIHFVTTPHDSTLEEAPCGEVDIPLYWWTLNTPDNFTRERERVTCAACMAVYEEYPQPATTKDLADLTRLLGQLYVGAPGYEGMHARKAINAFLERMLRPRDFKTGMRR